MFLKNGSIITKKEIKLKEILKIDGSFGEGGGSILRLSVAFSVLFKQPIKIFNIRAKRSKPGLRLQHLLGIQTLAQLTNSELSKCQVGTRELTFTPNQDISINEHIEIEINTAASLGLLIQPIQIASLGFQKPEKVEISLKGGGTYGKWAPSINYLENVTYQIFKEAGLKIQVEVERHGFYPKGGALIKVQIFPPKKQLKPPHLTELGHLEVIHGEIVVSNHLKKPRVAERIQNSANQTLHNLGLKSELNYSYVEAYSTGVGLDLWANTDTGAIISSGTIHGEKGTSSEEVGKNAVEKLANYIHFGIPVDDYLSDQLIPLIAYLEEPSIIKVREVTNHTKTNIELLQRFTPRKCKIIKENHGFLIKYL